MRSSDLTSGILELLEELHPEVQDWPSRHLINEGLLDSFDIVVLVAELEVKFGVSIGGDEVATANFTNLDSIRLLIERLLA